MRNMKEEVEKKYGLKNLELSMGTSDDYEDAVMCYRACRYWKVLLKLELEAPYLEPGFILRRINQRKIICLNNLISPSFTT